MFTTGSKLLIGSAFAAALFALRVRRHPGGLARHDRSDLGSRRARVARRDQHLRLATPTCRRWRSRRPRTSAAARSRATAQPVAAASPRSAPTMLVARCWSPTDVLRVIGMHAIVAGGTAEWMVQAWSERASADRAFNTRARDAPGPPDRAADPRCDRRRRHHLLVQPHHARAPDEGPRPSSPSVSWARSCCSSGRSSGSSAGASRTAMTGTFGLAVVALIAGGTYAGLNGERETHPHDTPGDIAADGECGTEETEADDLASQSVAGKANIAAELTFDGSQLILRRPRLRRRSPPASPCRARRRPTSCSTTTATSDARLVIEMHPGSTSDGNRPRRADLHAARRAGLDAVPDARVRAAGFRRRGWIRVHRARHRRHPPGGRAMSRTEKDPSVAMAVGVEAPAPRPLPPSGWARCSPCSRDAPRTPRRTRGSPPARTPRGSRTCSGRCSSSPASSACSCIAAVALGRDPLQATAASRSPSSRTATPALEITLTPSRPLILAVIGGFTVSTRVGAGQDRRHRVRRQRHRPAVVVGVSTTRSRGRDDLRCVPTSPRHRSSPAVSW